MGGGGRLNTLARGVSGKNIPAGSISIMGILDEETITTLAENAAAKLWNGFLKFGTVTAGLLGIFIIIKIIKTIFDTIIHGYQIHAVYGCGLHLLGAIWSSLTTLIIHLAKKKQPLTQNGDQPTTTDEGRQPTPAAREFKEAIQELKQISSENLLSKGGRCHVPRRRVYYYLTFNQVYLLFRTLVYYNHLIYNILPIRHCNP